MKRRSLLQGLALAPLALAVGEGVDLHAQTGETATYCHGVGSIPCKSKSPRKLDHHPITNERRPDGESAMPRRAAKTKPI